MNTFLDPVQDPRPLSLRGPKIEFRPPKINLPISAVPDHLCVAEPSPRVKELAEFLFADENLPIDVSSDMMYSNHTEREIMAAKKEATEIEQSAKIGRKPLAEDLRRTRKISTVVSDSEFEKITAAAIAAGLPASIWSRKTLLKAAEKEK